MSDLDKIAALKAENEALRRELQIAISECCNQYFWDGHYERVSNQFGIKREEAETAV